MISWVTIQDRIIKNGLGYINSPKAQEFTRFCDGYFRGLQKNGVYFSDITFDDLGWDGKENFFDEAWNLWISAKGSVEDDKIE